MFIYYLVQDFSTQGKETEDGTRIGCLNSICGNVVFRSVSVDALINYLPVILEQYVTKLMRVSRPHLVLIQWYVADDNYPPWSIEEDVWMPRGSLKKSEGIHMFITHGYCTFLYMRIPSVFETSKKAAPKQNTLHQKWSKCYWNFPCVAIDSFKVCNINTAFKNIKGLQWFAKEDHDVSDGALELSCHSEDKQAFNRSLLTLSANNSILA